MLKDSPTLSNSYLIKQLPTATVFIDKKYKIVYASDIWIAIFSQDKVDIIGQSIFKLFPGLSQKWKQELNTCFKGASSSMGVQKSIDKDNIERWYEWSYTSWYDGDENIIGAIIHTDDVTEAIKNNIALKKTKTLLVQQSEISKIGTWEYNIITNKIKWCSMTKAIHEVAPDYKPNIETGIDFYKEGHSRNAISMAIFEATDKGTPWRLKLQIITATGKEKWVIAAGKPVYEGKKVLGLIGTFQDIHEQVESDMKIRENEKLLKTLIDNLPLNVFVKDTESRKILVNKAECEYFGIEDQNELLGKNNFELYDEETARAYTNLDIQVMTTLKPILGKENICTKKNGSQTTFLTSKIPLINDQGIAFGLVGISMDITNLKEKEHELRSLIDVTSLQNKKLINFAHIVSHNLRSHSANFSMLLDFLRNEKDENEKTRIIGMLTDASESLLETLNNLNEVVAINTNVNVEKKSIKLSSKITAVQQNLSGFLLNNKAKIINNVPDDLEVKAVPAYIESILTNFITNGIKYKHPDRAPILIINARQKKDYTLVTIEDNGLGINLEKYGDKLFGMYKTFHNHKDARGIGLYITKNQIDSMNGKVKVQSEVGKGTKFNIFFNEKD